MKNQNSVSAFLHHEDAIYKTKVFINELQNVQEKYFSDLAQTLNMSENGKDWLFDYIYNTSPDEKYDGFEHYLEDFKQSYHNLIASK